MAVLGWIFAAVLFVVLLPLLLEIGGSLIGVVFILFFEIFGGLFMALFTIVGGFFYVIALVTAAIFQVVFGLVAFVFEMVAAIFLLVGKLLITPFLVLGDLLVYLERKWKGLGHQTVAALTGVLVLMVIVLLAYLTRPR